MSTARPLKAWNILDCGLGRRITGHHLWEARAMTGELVRRGHKVRLFTTTEALDPAEYPGVELIPIFTLNLYARMSEDPMWSAMENFIIHNRSFHRDLSRLDPAMFEDSVTVFPTLSENQILGLIRWLEQFPKEKRPRVAIGLRTPQEFASTNSRAQFYLDVFRAYQAKQGSDIAVFCRTARSAAMTETYIGVKARVIPVLAPDKLLARRVRAPTTGTSPMVVSFVGGARGERGAALLPEIVKRCASPEVQFFIQVRSDFEFAVDDMLRALSGHPHVRVYDGAMPRDDYYDMIANSISLILYDPEKYSWRDSGVYHEAKMLDAPVLVTAGTWMEDEVRKLGNGVVVSTFTPDAAAEGIARARHELPALRTAAVRAGRDAREQNGVARCLEAFENACLERA